MATTAVDICNLALSKLGDEARITSITPPYTSAQAMYCGQFYPFALADVMDEFDWKFAIKTATLSIAASNPDPRWLYCYTLPADFNKLISIYDSTTTSASYSQFVIPSQAFSITTNNSGVLVLLSNQVNAAIEYSILVSDPAVITPKVRTAVVWMLASYLCGPILKGDIAAAASLKILEGYHKLILPSAKDTEGHSRNVALTHTPSSIAARA